MKIPVSLYRNIVTGEMTFEYVEIEEKKLADFFEQNFSKANQKELIV